jgi:hypothetical protein
VSVSVSENLAVDFDHNFDGEKIFRPGVLSRVWYLGPCDDLLRGDDDDDDDDDDNADDDNDHTTQLVSDSPL